MSKPKGRLIPKGSFAGTRGVKSKESLFLPSLKYQYANQRLFPDYTEYDRWTVKDILKLVYSPFSQEVYYTTTTKFMELLLKEGELNRKQVNGFLSDNSLSKTTLVNVIIPRLKRLGIVELVSGYYKPSKDFGKFFMKVSKEYFSILKEHGIEV